MTSLGSVGSNWCRHFSCLLCPTTFSTIITVIATMATSDIGDLTKKLGEASMDENDGLSFADMGLKLDSAKEGER